MSFDNYTIFEHALELESPWFIQEINFSPELNRLDIYLGFTKGARFNCPKCGESHSVYSTNSRTWKHLHFFQYEAYIHLNLPRIRCKKCKLARYVPVPWSRPDSGFTLLFESLSIELARSVPLSTIAGYLKIQGSQIMRIIKHYVDEARSDLDMSKVKQLGVDETSKKKGHNYITVFTDLEEKSVLFATSGKDHNTIKKFSKDLIDHRGNPQQIKEACIDLSPAFIKGMKQYFPDTEITFDRFHVMQLVNKAVDEVRRQEVKLAPELKNSRYCWLKNSDKLNSKQKIQLKNLSKQHLKTARAYRIKLSLQDIYNSETKEEAEKLLKKWYFWATHSRLDSIIKLAKTIKKHWKGVINYFCNKISNGLAEGINSIIQSLKRRARGYKNTENLITMVYLLKGNLSFNLPAVCDFTYYR